MTTAIGTLSAEVINNIERATLATLNNAPAHVVTWEKTTPKGLTVQHTTTTATGLSMAPKIVQRETAKHADIAQLKNGNFAPLREALALFKGKESTALRIAVTDSLTIVDGDGALLAPVIAWDNVRVKTHAIAIARVIGGMSGLKGRKATWAQVLRDWAQ